MKPGIKNVIIKLSLVSEQSFVSRFVYTFGYSTDTLIKRERIVKKIQVLKEFK